MFVFEKIFAFDEHVMYLDSLCINNIGVYIQGKKKKRKEKGSAGSKLKG